MPTHFITAFVVLPVVGSCPLRTHPFVYTFTHYAAHLVCYRLVLPTTFWFVPFSYPPRTLGYRITWLVGSHVLITTTFDALPHVRLLVCPSSRYTPHFPLPPPFRVPAVMPHTTHTLLLLPTQFGSFTGCYVRVVAYVSVIISLYRISVHLWIFVVPFLSCG